MLGTCAALGENDRPAVSGFDADPGDAIDSSDEALVNVDCSGMTFMDAAGYRAFVATTNYAARRGDTLVLREMSSACAMLIRLCNSEGELGLEPRRRQPAHNGRASSMCGV